MARHRDWQSAGGVNAEAAAVLAAVLAEDVGPPARAQRKAPAPATATVAEAIAAVVADVRAGRAVPHLAELELAELLLARAREKQPTVDVTAVYQSMVERATGPGIRIYDDFPMVMSPWPAATIGYVNQHGNVLVMQTHAGPWSPAMRWKTNNPVDWDRVKWWVEASMWVGGRDQTGRAVETHGPVRLLQNAVYDDGGAADLRWVSLVSRKTDDPATWEIPTAVLSATFNFLSCSNVEIAEPVRAFPVRQRLRKTRVEVQTIVVRPAGKRSVSRSDGAVRAFDALDTPLTSVRGSFGRYGPKFGRGLLFGRHEGQFWRPAHARGAGDGAVQKDYVLRPE